MKIEDWRAYLLEERYGTEGATIRTYNRATFLNMLIHIRKGEFDFYKPEVIEAIVSGRIGMNNDNAPYVRCMMCGTDTIFMGEVAKQEEHIDCECGNRVVHYYSLDPISVS